MPIKGRGVKMDNNELMQSQPPVKKNGNGVLIAILSILIVAIIAVCITILGYYMGWFSIKKNIIELSENLTSVEEDGSVSISVENFSELDRPVFSFSGYDDGIVEVTTGRNGKIVITGISEGTTSVTVSAKDCRNEIIDVTVNHARPVTKLELEGMAYTTGTQDYYFVSGSEYAVISDFYEEYARGDYTVKKMDTALFADIYSAHYNDIQKEMDGLVTEGTFYYVTLNGADEYFGGSHYSGNEDYLIISVNRKKLAIYDASWDELFLAEEIDMMSTDEIDRYFDFETSSPMTPASSSQTSSSASAVQGTIPYSSFGGFGPRSVVKETWKFAAYGNSFIYRDSNGNLHMVTAADFNADKAGERLHTAGGAIKFFAVKDGAIIYCTDADEVGIYYINSGDSEVICDNLAVSDMTIMGDMIYLTDYESIWEMDVSGSCSEIWDYGAWAIDMDEDYMYVYDGYAWDLLDLEADEFVGEFVSELDGDYEADVIEAAGDYVFTVIFEYDSEKVYVRAININTGDNYNLTSGAYGAKMDTYSAAFIDKYIYYTTGDGETINRVDVTTGENISLNYSSTDIYYSNELMEINGVLYGAGFDDNDEAVVFVINQSNLAIEDIYYLD